MSSRRQASVAQTGGVTRPLRILLVEDYEPDAILLARTIARGGFNLTTRRVDSPQSMHRALQEAPWDLVLCDYAMPGFGALEALAILQERGIDTPFIIVSGHIAEETAVAAMKAGAHDYIMKDRLARLLPAVERELREAEVRRARLDSELALRRAHDELEIRVEARTADLQTANAKLENVLEERRRLENELLEIAENERRRIGFDLHDDLGQKLTGVSLMLKGLERRLAIDQHPGAEDARTIQRLIDEVVHHTHHLARQFSELDVAGDDLPAVLEGLAGHVRSLFRIKCTFQLRGNPPKLPSDATLQLYKIAQEAVSNAIKHGHAKRVAIELTVGDDRLQLTVRNDGMAFSPPQASRRGLGLRIMNYRANTIGAALSIASAGQSGALVRCVLPFETSLRPSSGASQSA